MGIILSGLKTSHPSIYVYTEVSEFRYMISNIYMAVAKMKILLTWSINKRVIKDIKSYKIAGFYNKGLNTLYTALSLIHWLMTF